MTEESHDHSHDDHDHDRDDVACQHHGHAHGHEDEGPLKFTDPAGEHLAAALRTSFRLLAAIMVLGVGAFLAMGFRFVRPGEVAIRTVFGKVVGVTPAGLAYNWPAPIGGIETISVGERKIVLEDFWMNETKRDQLEPDLLKRQAPRGGLRPGWDGALLTGDRNLLHMRIICKYQVRLQSDGTVENHPALLFRKNVPDPDELMRSVLCMAGIRTAATWTAYGLQRSDRKAFKGDLLRTAQDALDDLESGLKIRAIDVVNSTWPLRALPDYAAAQRAVQEKGAALSQARKEANELLGATAGDVATRKLVGTIKDVTGGSARPDAAAAGRDDENHDLIGQYNRALRRDDAPRAEALMARIENVLGEDATGEVSTILSDARTYRNALVQRVRGRVERFKKKLPAYRENPRFAIDRWWMEVREDLLASPTAEKHFITLGEGKTVLRINRDPDIARQSEREWMSDGLKKNDE